MNKINDLIKNADWLGISKMQDPKSLVQNLSFQKAMSLSYHFLFNQERSDDLTDYGIEMLNEIRKNYSNEWMSDWKNDVFFGDACFLGMLYKERYAAYMRAFNRLTEVPASLLISIAECYLSPEPCISVEDAERFAKEALGKELSIEGVILLRGLYSEKNDMDNFVYWDNVFQQIKDLDIHTNVCWPEFLNLDKIIDN